MIIGQEDSDRHLWSPSDLKMPWGSPRLAPRPRDPSGRVRRRRGAAYASDRRQQGGHEGLLDDKGIGAQVSRRPAIGIFGVHGYDDDLSVGALRLDPPQGLQAIDPRH